MSKPLADYVQLPKLDEYKEWFKDFADLYREDGILQVTWKTLNGPMQHSGMSHRAISHRDDRGRPTGTNPLFLNAHAAVDKFLGPARLGLGRKAGPLVFQFSPVPHPELRTLEARIKLFERITTFLAELCAPGDGLLLAAEFRNYELFTPRMMKRLRTLGVSPVIGLHPAMPPVKPCGE